jgi:hypothetical protein
LQAIPTKKPDGDDSQDFFDVFDNNWIPNSQIYTKMYFDHLFFVEMPFVSGGGVD